MPENRRTFLGGIAFAVIGTAGCSGTPSGGQSFTIASEAFDEGETLPERHTCSGSDVSPRLTFEGVPVEAETLAVIVDDPDAPGGTFTHWILVNVGADRTVIPEAVEPTETVGSLDDARQGRNDFGSVGYRGPCPPEDDDPHTYRFRGYALDSRLDVEPGAERETVEPALEDATLATDVVTGTFGR